MRLLLRALVASHATMTSYFERGATIAPPMPTVSGHPQEPAVPPASPLLTGAPAPPPTQPSSQTAPAPQAAGPHGPHAPYPLHFGQLRVAAPHALPSVVTTPHAVPYGRPPPPPKLPPYDGSWDYAEHAEQCSAILWGHDEQAQIAALVACLTGAARSYYTTLPREDKASFQRLTAAFMEAFARRRTPFHAAVAFRSCRQQSKESAHAFGMRLQTLYRMQPGEMARDPAQVVHYFIDGLRDETLRRDAQRLPFASLADAIAWASLYDQQDDDPHKRVRAATVSTGENLRSEPVLDSRLDGIVAAVNKVVELTKRPAAGPSTSTNTSADYGAAPSTSTATRQESGWTRTDANTPRSGVCFRCHRPGHYARQCTLPMRDNRAEDYRRQGGRDGARDRQSRPTWRTERRDDRRGRRERSRRRSRSRSRSRGRAERRERPAAAVRSTTADVQYVMPPFVMPGWPQQPYCAPKPEPKKGGN